MFVRDGIIVQVLVFLFFCFFCLFFFFFVLFCFLGFFFVTSPENFLPSLKVYPFALCPSKLTLTIFLSVESKLREVVLH